MDFFKLAIGLASAMVCNILMGTSLAHFKKEFDKEKCMEGIYKALVIVLSISCLYLCSFFNPDILVLNVNGQNVNLIQAMEYIFKAGILLYGAKDITKLMELLQIKTSFNNLQKEETVVVPKDNEIK